MTVSQSVTSHNVAKTTVIKLTLFVRDASTPTWIVPRHVHCGLIVITGVDPPTVTTRSYCVVGD